MKIYDAGRKVIVNRINSYLNSRIVHFLMNLHLFSRSIWLTLSGEDEFSAEGRFGGNKELNANGEQFAHVLASWVEKQTPKVSVWTSSLKRSISTARYINRTKVQSNFFPQSSWF